MCVDPDPKSGYSVVWRRSYAVNSCWHPDCKDPRAVTNVDCSKEQAGKELYKNFFAEELAESLCKKTGRPRKFKESYLLG